MLTIHDHWLPESADVKHLSTPKNTVKFATGQPDTIIIHYTAGSSAESSANYLARDDVKASAHVVVARDGLIYQLVPFDTVSWHAGTSSYGGRSGFNSYAIGIEIDNAGVLTRDGDHFTAWFGGSYSEDEVLSAIHRNETASRYWHRYTQDQLARVEALVVALLAAYPNIRLILGHEEVSPGRKQDPGPAYPLDDLRNRLLPGATDDEASPGSASAGIVTASSLNIRDAPTASADKVADPLPRGTEVEILETSNGWHRVRTQIEGWVSADYVRRGSGS